MPPKKAVLTRTVPMKPKAAPRKAASRATPKAKGATSSMGPTIVPRGGTTWGFRPDSPLPDPTDSLLHIYATSAYTVDRVLTPDQKGSSSPSIVFFGTHKESNQPVAGKVSIDYSQQPMPTKELTELLDDSLEDFAMLSYEACVYQKLTETANPHIVRWISTQYIPVDRFIAPEVRPFLRELGINSIIPDELAHLVKGCQINITERREKIVAMADHHTPNAGLKNLLFQLIFSLLLLHQDGFQHNDLHMKNVLIDIQPDISDIEYRFDGLTFDLGLNAGKVILFDWDFGYSEACGRNAGLSNMCSSMGLCNGLNARIDFYKLLRGFRIPGDPAFAAFCRDMGVNVRPIVKRKDYKRGSGAIVQTNHGIMCNYNGKHCKPFPPKEPGYVGTPADAIRHPYFAEFQV